MILNDDILLSAKSLCRNFGGVRALQDLDIRVDRGTIHALIGPNGSGKTTFVNLVSGLLRPSSGGIFFDGKPIAGLSADRIARLGVARTFQTVRIFPEESCLDNVVIGRYCATRSHFWPILFRPPFCSLKEEDRARHKALELLASVALLDKAETPAGQLTLIEQRKLEIARGLAQEPKLFMLDEPTAGMDPTEVDAVNHLVRVLQQLGTTVVLIAHDMRLVMNVSDVVSVLCYGHLIARGTPSEVVSDRGVVEAYLGTE